MQGTGCDVHEPQPEDTGPQKDGLGQPDQTQPLDSAQQLDVSMDASVPDLSPPDIPLCPMTDACLYKCGDGTLTPPWEQCDGKNLGGKTCKSFGYIGGTLYCNKYCKYNTWWCIAKGCGDGTLSSSEECEGGNLRGKTCKSFGYQGGTLGCYNNCKYNKSGCFTCGDGIISGTEQCEGNNLNGQTCKSLGYKGGTLKCNPKKCAYDKYGIWRCAPNSCTYDTWGCIPFGCGNGVLNAKEQCDGTNLAGQTCQTQGFFKGSLKCHHNCKLDTSGCSNCGNGKADFGEGCDGKDLAGQTCITAGFDWGPLSCKADCTLDTSKCEHCKCGDGLVGGVEQCDKTNLNNTTCKSLGYDGGTLKCQNNCLFDTSGCHKCGDGKITSPEECESKDLGGKTCSALGYFGGSLTCGPTCMFDKTGCTNCGNSKIDAGESCDGSALGGQTCKTQGLDFGLLKCTKKCTYDIAGCFMFKCGDGKVTGKEDCDGTNLNGKSCQSLGYLGGALSCSSKCLFNKSKCTNCGNNKVNPGEQCDGTDLNNKTCQSYGYTAGKLACTSGCKLSAAGCTKCGDGKLKPGEACDGKNLGGKTCKSFGYYTGYIKCSPTCTHVTTGCHNCGNGKVEVLEACDSTNMAGKTCKSFGFDGGYLKCSKTCLFDTSKCTNCGNGKVDGAKEQCDGTNLNNKTCQSLGYVGGTLSCRSWCVFDRSKCHSCGNNQIDSGEQCDGTFLAGKTCKKLGYDGGTLKCTGGCKLDASGCWKLKVLFDDSFAHFNKGTASEAGAKLFIAGQGRVQLLDRLDLNGDGYLDLAFGNHSDAKSSSLNSYIYWGGATGFAAGTRAELPTQGGAGTSVADLNGDGHLDLVFSNHRQTQPAGNTLIHKYKVNSFIYWGANKGSAGTGYSANYRTELPTLGATGNSVADLNRDGYLDIVFSNTTDGTSSKVNAYIYWGSSGGFSKTSRTELPVTAAAGGFHGPRNLLADLDNDGYLDITFASHSDASGVKVNSHIYWGSKAGFSTTSRTDLPTVGAAGLAAADLNSDGYLDLVFANHGDGKSAAPPSYIYWGSASGFSTAKRTSLATLGAVGVSVADLNGDGKLDIVFSNHGAYPTYAASSYIYWGSAAGYSASNRTGLPTLGATSNLVADLDGDGDLDIAFANQHSSGSAAINSYIYWGSASGFSATKRAELPTNGAAGLVLSADPGAVVGRGKAQTFTSRALDTGLTAPIYYTLAWLGTVPAKGSLKIQVRTATSIAGLKGATWYGPTSTSDYYPGVATALNTMHNGHRYIQYRAVFSSDFSGTPVLDRVSISYH